MDNSFLTYQAVAQVKPFDLCVLECVCRDVPDWVAPHAGVVDQVEVVEGIFVQLPEHVVAQVKVVNLFQKL